MKKGSYFILAVLGVIFLGAVVLQNNKRVETPIKQENVGQEDRSEKIEVKGQLVEGFPQFPTFPGSVIDESYKKESGGKVGYEAAYLTDKSPQEAMAWYKEELEKQGWTITDEAIEGTESEFYILVERDGQKVNVFAESEEGETEISVEIPLQ